MKADPHAVAAQLGHTVDVSLNTYAQSPVESRVEMVNDLERLISGEPERCAIDVQKKPEDPKLLKKWSGRRDSNPRRPAWEAGNQIAGRNWIFEYRTSDSDRSFRGVRRRSTASPIRTRALHQIKHPAIPAA
jgi:hypothetical protein